MHFLTTLEPRQFVSARCSDATRIHAEKDIKKLINEYTRQIKRGGGGVDMLRSVDAPALPTVVPSWKCQNRRSASAWRASVRLLMHPSNKRDGHSDSFRHTRTHTLTVLHFVHNWWLPVNLHQRGSKSISMATLEIHAAYEQRTDMSDWTDVIRGCADCNGQFGLIHLFVSH